MKILNFFKTRQKLMNKIYILEQQLQELSRRYQLRSTENINLKAEVDQLKRKDRS
jgi:hypothetical protein